MSTKRTTTASKDSQAPKSEGPHRLYLVDGSGYIFRAFHALPPMTRPDGTPVNAVYGFCTMLLKLLDDLEAESVAVIFDAGRRSFRNDIYSDYKAHRPEPPGRTGATVLADPRRDPRLQPALRRDGRL